MRPYSEQRFSGLAISPGIAIGAAYSSREQAATVHRQRIQASDIDGELRRLEAAIGQSLKQLNKLRGRLSVLPDDAREEIGPLIDAYIHMLGPTRLVRGMQQRVRERLVSAETSVLDECEAHAALLAGLPVADGEDERASRERRAEEVREIGRRVVRNLTRAGFRSFNDLPEGAVLVAEALRPADAALIDPARIAAVVTEEGGVDGHTAIMLRALGLPTVLGVAGINARLHAGGTIVVDGGAGTVILDPTPATLAQAREDALSHARERQMLFRLRRLPAETQDGVVIQLHANIELPAELTLIAQAGATGIGLMRTEFIFMNRENLPDEAVQEAVYRQVVLAMAGDPVTIRVLDWGGEKQIDALSAAGLVPDLDDPNPALGLRGVRLLLRQSRLLETQLTAILRASLAGPVRIMVPMITNLDEVVEARAIYDRVVRRLRRDGEALPETLPPFGIMVETPGAALTADALAQVADFFAIGTNDLTMYTLAVDRVESSVAALYDPLHAAVLRLVQFTTQAGMRAGKPVSVCGEIAGNPQFTALLMGLGVRQFSMSAGSLPRVKQLVRSVRLEECEALARAVMDDCDPRRIRAMIADFNRAHLG